MTEKQVVEHLKKILPALIPVSVAGDVVEWFEREFARRNIATTFEKFLERCELPDLSDASVQEVRNQLNAAFGPENVTLKVNQMVEGLDIVLKQKEGDLAGQIRVHPTTEANLGQALKYISFPVALPGDPELTWNFAKLENMTNYDAGRLLEKVVQDFWKSKKGQKLIRDRVNCCFAEFVNHVPAAMLREVGLKRHYKEPEAIRIAQI